LTNPGELTDFEGLFIPLPHSLTDATEAGDPRTPITTLYASRDDYLAQASAAARSLADQGYLLDEDLGTVADHAAALWDWVFQNAPAH
jgi:hypothetical protein